MTKGTQEVAKAAGAAVFFAYVSQRWPRWGGPLLLLVVVGMLVKGAERGYFKVGKPKGA